jgi:ribonuclease BN (tRNA processing enzyme)
MEHVHPAHLDAIVLSHLHFDHCSDLFVMRYALDQQEVREGEEKRRVPLYTPAEPYETLKAITTGALFAQHTVKGGDELQIGTLHVRFVPMAHPVPTNGMRITGSDGAVLFFTGDTKPYLGMEQGPMGADALLADACFVNASQTGPHMNVKEACALARDAGVKTLYLTHMWGKYDTEAEVKKEIDFPSAVVVKERGRYCI